MAKNFQPNGMPVLIGSLPHKDHEEASKLVFQYTYEIPIWVQLPAYKEEGMIVQFMPGLPGFTVEGDKSFINTADENFDDEVLRFYEECMAVMEGAADIGDSRFVLKPDTAKGFFVLMENLKKLSPPPAAIKGHITGPITFGTAIKDQNKKAVFYDTQLRDMAVKLLALKARWQVRKLAEFGYPVIIFFDEPALAGFGSSEFISISRDEVLACFEEVIDAVHQEGGLAGIHVCANADWSLLLNSSVDIVNFDAYAYFDTFILYAEAIKNFIESGRMIAWGIVPTLQKEDIEKETTDSLLEKLTEQFGRIEAIGVDRTALIARSFITPSCGAGSLSVEHATKVLKLTRELSDSVQKR